MKKYLTHVIWVLVAVAAFVGGMYYGKASAPPAAGGRFGNFTGTTRDGAAFVGRNDGGFIAGQVVAENAESITLALPNGNSEIVFYSSSTAIEKPAPASISDITPGTNVTVAGTPNSDGSLTAQMIQVRAGGAPPGGIGG